jgi:hypothetical protein
MRVPRETGKIVVRDVIAKIVEKQKRIEVGCIAKAERAAQMNTRTLNGRFGLNHALYRTK